MRSVALFLVTAATVACTGPGADDHLDIVFDVCSPLRVVTTDPSAERARAIDQGIALWRGYGAAAVERGTAADIGGGPTVEIRFEHAAGNFHGVYEDEAGIIFINTDLADAALAVTIAHELGHAFGLWHVDSAERTSVMNPGNLRTTPTSADEASLTALWGACGAGDAAATLAPGAAASAR